MPRWSVLFRNLPVQRIVGLELEVQEPTCVTLVRAAPRVVARGRFEIRAAQQRRDVIKDSAKQRVGGVGVAPAVVVIQFGEQPHELAGIQAQRLCSCHHACADVRVNVGSQAIRRRPPGVPGLPGDDACEHDLPGRLIHRLHLSSCLPAGLAPAGPARPNLSHACERVRPARSVRGSIRVVPPRGSPVGPLARPSRSRTWGSWPRRSASRDQDQSECQVEWQTVLARADPEPVRASLCTRSARSGALPGISETLRLSM